MLRAITAALLGASVPTGCLSSPEPGYGKSNPGEIVCGCHDPDACYDEAARLAKEKGETAESAEQLMYFSQCACFEGLPYACDGLGYFARDWTAACARGEDVANACTIAGFVYLHGVQNRGYHGKSFDRDSAAAQAAFRRACDAGSKVACAHVGGG